MEMTPLLCNSRSSTEQPEGALFYQLSWWAAEIMQDSFAFLILGVGRLREDQFRHQRCFS